MGLHRFSWREISMRPLRATLTLLSISIGVGAVVAVLMTTSTTRRAQREMLRTISGKADVEIVADGSGFPYEVFKQIQELPGVQAAVPSLNRFGVLFTQDDRRARAQVLGINPLIDRTVREYELVAGEMPGSLKHILLDKSFAESLGIALGDQVKLLAKKGMLPFTVTGLVQPTGGSALTLSGTVYLALPAAQNVFQASGKIDQIQMIAGAGIKPEELESRLTEFVPDGATIRTVRTENKMSQEMMFAPRNGLLMAVAFAIIIAIFIIYNTFQMSVGERRKQFGILRALGATPRQIQWMILRESVWMSLLGSMIGCLAGAYGAGWLNRITELILQVELPGRDLQVWPFLVAIVVGVGVSLFGAAIPARSAARVHPMEAIRMVVTTENRKSQSIRTPLALLTVPVGLVSIWTATSGIFLGMDVAGIVLILLGCVLMIPRLLEPACQILTKILEPWIGVPAKLAQKQLLRHVGRTSMTVGVLFVAMATSIGMAGNVLDNVRNIQQWYSQTIIGDFFVRASLPDFSSGTAADLPEDVLKQLNEIQGVQSVSPMRFAHVQSQDDTLLLVANEYIGRQHVSFDLSSGTRQQALEGLSSGQVVLGSVLALRRGLGIGDTLELQGDAGKTQLKVAAITNDYLAGGLTIYMDRQHARQSLGIDGMDAVIVNAASDQLASVESQLQAVCQQQGLILQSYAQLIQQIDGMINSVVGSLWTLLALGCAIAAMGLINTLTMNILEQTREIGMLRVVAMTRWQVRVMICTQALILGLLGIVPGIVIGVLVQYVMEMPVAAFRGTTIQFVFRPGLFLGVGLIGLVLVLFASWIPAERAARLKLQSALQYE